MCSRVELDRERKHQKGFLLYRWPKGSMPRFSDTDVSASGSCDTTFSR